MNDEIIPILTRILAEERADLTRDHHALEEALRFNARKMRVETNILCAAAKVNVPRTIQRNHSKTSHPDMVERLAARLSRDFCMLDDAALWAVLSWAKALDIPLQVEEAEILARLTPEEKKAQDPPQSPEPEQKVSEPKSSDSPAVEQEPSETDDAPQEEPVELKPQDLPKRRAKNSLLPDDFYSKDDEDEEYSTEHLMPVVETAEATRPSAETKGESEEEVSEQEKPHEPHDVVEFMDPVLEQRICEHLKTDHVTYADAETVRKLEICSRDATSLEGLQAFTNLRYLDIRHNKIGDISPVASLVNLEVLILDYNLVESLKPITRLEKLSKLSAHSNLVTNIVPLVTLSRKGVFDSNSILVFSGNPLSEDARSVHIKLLREQRINVVVSR